MYSDSISPIIEELLEGLNHYHQKNNSIQNLDGILYSTDLIIITNELWYLLKFLNNLHDESLILTNHDDYSNNYFKMMLKDNFSDDYDNDIELFPKVFIKNKYPYRTLYKYDLLFQCLKDFTINKLYTVITFNNCQECNTLFKTMPCSFHNNCKDCENNEKNGKTEKCNDCMFTICKECQRLQTCKDCSEEDKIIQFKESFVYAIKVEQRFSINGIIQCINRFYQIEEYLDKLKVTHQYSMINFILMYNDYKTEWEEKVLQLFFYLFNNPNDDTYERLKS